VPAKQLQIVPGGVNGAKEMVGTRVPPPFFGFPVVGQKFASDMERRFLCKTRMLKRNWEKNRKIETKKKF
jgi:hypothetical protein